MENTTETGELIKYGNQVNDLDFKGFGAMDFDIFTLAIGKLQDRGQEVLELSGTELRAALGYAGKKKQFTEYLAKATKTVFDLKLEYVTYEDGFPADFDRVHFFRSFRYSAETDTLRICLESGTVPFLNQLKEKFTLFPLQEYVELTSKYSKRLYMLLKQWRSVGHCPTQHTSQYIPVEELKKLFGIPDKYDKYGSKFVRQKVLEPAIKEISDKGYFENLELHIHYATKPGKPVVGYSFTFTPQKPPKALTEEQKVAIEEKAAPDKKEQKKAKKNRFNDYEQRDLSKQEISDLEMALLKAPFSDPKEPDEQLEGQLSFLNVNMDIGEET